MATKDHRDSSPAGDSDSDLQYAIALSLQQEESSDTVTNQRSIDPPPKDQHETKHQYSSQPSSASFGSLALNRKAMEEERLARLRKRSAPEAGLSLQPKPQRLKVSGKASSPEDSNRVMQQNALPYPTGTVKKTWAFGYPRTEDDIKIEEVLQKNDLQLAIFSSFQWDERWILSKVDMTKTKMIFVAYAADESQKATMQANVPPGVIRFCFPPMNGIGCMHSKLQLLKYERYLRIVIPSGNLVPYDWGETGVLENMVFLIDLPRLEPAAKSVQTAFGTELRRFLQALGLEEKLIQSLDNYDFTETSRYGFIHTIAGTHTDDAWQYTGYCGLGRAVERLGFATGDPVDVDYVCSSLGSLNAGYLTALYNACQGDSGMKEYESRQSKKGKSKGAGNAAVAEPLAPSTLLRDHFRIYFPTHETVSGSRGGTPAAGTICFQQKWWNASTFPRDLLRDAVSVRHGLLMHDKAMFVRKTGRQHASPGWAYVGSANISESAWGRLVKDRASGKAKLTCRNWECGVLIPVSHTAAQSLQASQESLGLGMFKDTVPVPMHSPASSYQSDDGAPKGRPWFFSEAH